MEIEKSTNFDVVDLRQELGITEYKEGEMVERAMLADMLVKAFIFSAGDNRRLGMYIGWLARHRKIGRLPVVRVLNLMKNLRMNLQRHEKQYIIEAYKLQAKHSRNVGYRDEAILSSILGAFDKAAFQIFGFRILRYLSKGLDRKHAIWHDSLSQALSTKDMQKFKQEINRLLPVK